MPTVLDWQERLAAAGVFTLKLAKGYAHVRQFGQKLNMYNNELDVPPPRKPRTAAEGYKNDPRPPVTGVFGLDSAGKQREELLSGSTRLGKGARGDPSRGSWPGFPCVRPPG
ncbi:hypothetical protein THAOC_17587 [Thalassiosira oceanica]|uniref:Uncharacterized protein n=1 Tax=Thalassiosira oceanica TaxID=159749 RepID=K0SUB4_THAOC|nr:hypothetical protein THAOC_17587 [Thalassiosira oceanica]|eukprot:EJK61847.1 hypothetical protein THAOC_17587 [Thalassiosira oceanica]